MFISDKNQPSLENVYQIKNIKRELDNNAKRKQYPVYFYVLFSLVCVALLYATIDNALFSGASLVPLLCMCVYPAMCAVVILFAPRFLVPVALFGAPVLYVLRFFLFRFDGETALNFVSATFSFILCIVTAVIVVICTKNSRTKTTFLASISVFACFVIVSIFLFNFAYTHGKLGVSYIVESIDKTLENVVDYNISEIESLMNDQKFFQEAQKLLITKQSGDVSKEQILNALRNDMNNIMVGVKASIPAVIALVAMLFGFAVNFFYGIFVKIFKINVFVCIVDKEWCYRVNPISAKFFNLLWIVVLLGTFLGLPQNLSIALANVLVILMPLMFVSGIRGLYGYFTSKGMHFVGATALCSVLVLLALSVMGGLAFFVVGALGVYYITENERKDKVLAAKIFNEDLDYNIAIVENDFIEDTQGFDKENKQDKENEDTQE